MNGPICNLRDGGTSVLVDNTILPLSGLDGSQWARDLYTVERRSTRFVSIGFDFGITVQVRRVELVMFNCHQWSIRASIIEIYADASTDNFPRSDPTSLDSRVGSRLLDNTTNSCGSLYRDCVPLSVAIQSRIYYIVFPNAAGSDRVYLAETIFYSDTSSCGPAIPVTEPITPTDSTSMATTTEGTYTNREFIATRGIYGILMPTIINLLTDVYVYAYLN